MKTKIIQITTGGGYVFALCEDGSVWKRPTSEIFLASDDRPWARFA